MDKLTFDTNVWRDWAWCEGITSEKRHNDNQRIKRDLKQSFSIIETFRTNGDITIGYPLQLFLDFKATNYVINSPDLSYLQPFMQEKKDFDVPAIFSFPLVFPFVFGKQEKFEKLFELIFPKKYMEWLIVRKQPFKTEYERDKVLKKFQSSLVDTMLVYAHSLSDADVFITNDSAVAECEALSTMNINVSKLDDYLSLIT